MRETTVRWSRRAVARRLRLESRRGRALLLVAEDVEYGNRMQEFEGFQSVCNHTKWGELRNCVLSYKAEFRPEFRSKCITNGYLTNWDGEWFYHFLEGGFEDVEWIELEFPPKTNTHLIEDILRIGLAGERVDGRLRLYGHVPNGTFAKKIDVTDFQ